MSADQKTPDNIDFFEALGLMTTVAMASEYRTWTILEIERYLVPALRVGQCKIYFDDHGNPSAFVTWAMLDDESHQALLDSGRNPPPDRWASGTNLWFMDIVVPFGNLLSIVRDLQRSFPGHHAHSIRRNADGSVRHVNRWRNTLANLAYPYTP